MSKISYGDGGISLEELHHALDYDQNTGIFKWRFSIRRVDAGGIAGHQMPDGYWRIGFRKRYFLAHRLAWFYVYGEWPKGEIDHINRQRADNRISNLREATRGQNVHNRIVKNKTGFRGVYLSESKKKWYAQIKINGKSQHLGFFNTPEEASAAYKTAAKIHFDTFSPRSDNATLGPVPPLHHLKRSPVGIFEALLNGANPDKVTTDNLGQGYL